MYTQFNLEHTPLLCDVLETVEASKHMYAIIKRCAQTETEQHKSQHVHGGMFQNEVGSSD